MYLRYDFMKNLALKKDVKLIKLIIGFRGFGKNTIINHYILLLSALNVDDDHIIRINVETSIEFTKAILLIDYVKKRIKDNKMHYLFIENINYFEKVSLLFTEFDSYQNLDIYYTASSNFFKGGLFKAYALDKYTEINLYNLSFRNFYDRNRHLDNDSLLDLYLKNGGFPFSSFLGHGIEKIDSIIYGFVNHSILKEIEMHQGVYSKVYEIPIIINTIYFLASHVGEVISADLLKLSFPDIRKMLISEYIEILINIQLVHKLEHFSLSKNTILEEDAKYYFCDHSLLKLYNCSNLEKIFENIVYLELKKNYQKIYSGSFDDCQIDFVCYKDGKMEMFQFIHDVIDNINFIKKIMSLQKCRHKCDKYIIIGNKMALGEYCDVSVVNILDWLLKKFD